MGTILGIDYGHKKLGFAVGQSITGSARPLCVVYQNGSMWGEIDKIFEQWRPQGVVIGKPELADGKPHPLEKMIENFIVEVKSRYNAVIHRENEAYTSFEAASMSQGKKMAPIDAEAAAIFLESWMRSNP